MIRPLQTRILFFLFLLVPALQLQAQVNDTAQVPYWISMMQDPNENFFRTQRAFEQYWEGRTIEKSSGWKVFKRWEAYWRTQIDAAGNLPAPDRDMREMENWMRISASGFPKGLGPAPCNTRGSWKEIGPRKYPHNLTWQPTGLGRINGLAFHPTDSNIVYAGAPAGGFWISKDQGKTWSCRSDSFVTLGVSSIVVNPNKPDSIFIGSGDRDAGDAAGLGVFVSSDGGKTFKASSTGMGNQTVGKLIMHPQKPWIMLAATGGGIYRSVNGGKNWSQIITGNYKDILFKPGNPNIVYASRDGLFFRSTNAGASFAQITTGLPTTGIVRGAIAVTPAAHEYVYFVITRSQNFYGMYRSADSGTSFSTQSTTPNIMDYSANGSGTGGQAWYDLDIAANPVNKETVYVAGVNIFKSTNGGVNWTINAHWVGSSADDVHADHHVLEFQPKTNNLFTGNDGGVYFTRNGGSRWNNICEGLGVAQIYKLGQSATDEDYIINGYQDNGSAVFDKEFKTVYGGDGMDCSINPKNRQWAYGELYYGSIFRLNNNWADRTVAANGTNGITESGDWVTPFILREGDPKTMIVGYKNVWRSSDVTVPAATAITYTRISNSLGGNNGTNIRFLENSPARNEILYMARWDGKLYRTGNLSGANVSWTDLSSSMPNAGVTPTALECHPFDSNTVYMVQSNKVYRSRNKGVTWTNLTSNLPAISLNCIVFDSSSKAEGLYVGTNAGVFYRDSNMTNWVLYNQGLPLNSRVTDIEIWYSPEGRGYSKVVVSTYGRGNWRSPLYDYSNRRPDTRFAMNDTQLCTGSPLQLKDRSGFTPTQWQWIISPGGYQYINGTDSTMPNPELSFSKPGYYSITLISANCNGDDTMSITNAVGVFQPVPSASCVPNTNFQTSNYNIGIFSVELANMKNESGGYFDDGPYRDFSCTRIARIKPNTKYYIRTRTGSGNNEYVKVYIDYNNNGIFTDPGENVVTTPSRRTFHYDSFTTPAVLVKNKTLRMRILSDFNSISGPCATLSYGQGEDYGVYVDDPVPGFKPSKTSFCYGDTVMFTDTTQGIGRSYAWDFGTGAVPAMAAGKGPHRVFYSNPGYKTVKLTVNGNIVLNRDSAVRVRVKPEISAVIKSGKTTLCERQSVTLAARDVLKTGGLSYSWYKNSSKINGKTDSLLSLGNTLMADSGIYHAIATLNGCSDTTQTVQVRIFARPAASIAVNSAQQCLKGNLFSFSSSASSIAQGNISAYRWTFGDTDSSLQNNPAHSYRSAGSYQTQLEITSDKGSAIRPTAASACGRRPSPHFTLTTATSASADTTLCLPTSARSAAAL